MKDKLLSICLTIVLRVPSLVQSDDHHVDTEK